MKSILGEEKKNKYATSTADHTQKQQQTIVSKDIK